MSFLSHHSTTKTVECVLQREVNQVLGSRDNLTRGIFFLKTIHLRPVQSCIFHFFVVFSLISRVAHSLSVLRQNVTGQETVLKKREF